MRACVHTVHDVYVCKRKHIFHARLHRHGALPGKVKNQDAEALLPSFDFERVVGDRLKSLTRKSSAVVMVLVDLVDFDGSFPVHGASSTNRNKPRET